jgi:transcriptional regulator GlxA family with amidase domain
LLDGRRATTHWASQRLFAQRYPRVMLQDASIIVDEGSILTSGGATSFLNLLMYLVEKRCGPEVAHVAVLQAQRLMEEQPQTPISVQGLCSAVGLSRRSLERRFKIATGNTPREYLQRVRVEAAKKRLERTADSIEQIVSAVGYEDLPTFRRLFSRVTGMSPSRYRQRYGLASSG